MDETNDRHILNRSNIDTLEKLIDNMKYGSISIIIQDGRIVQIDKTEKYRIKS